MYKKTDKLNTFEQVNMNFLKCKYQRMRKVKNTFLKTIYNTHARLVFLVLWTVVDLGFCQGRVRQ